jgi:hypothetical protein
MPTTRTSRRLTKRKSEDDDGTDDTRNKSNNASPSPHSPGTGTLIDKTV